MEFLVAIDADSAFGVFLLSIKGKVGGATTTLGANGKEHPVIVATNLRWDAPAFVRMTHLQNPGVDDRLPREIAVPAATVLAAAERIPADQPSGVQQPAPSSLH